MTDLELRRGDVWWVSLDPSMGAEMKKKRPCVIVQRNAANFTSPTTIVCPLTAARGRKTGLVNVPVLPETSGLRRPSVVLCNQIRVVDATRFGTRIGRLDAATLESVERGLRAILDV